MLSFSGTTSVIIKDTVFINHNDVTIYISSANATINNSKFINSTNTYIVG
jgi:hypothetical protein